MQHQRRHRALVALVAAALPLAAFGDAARLAWQHDGVDATGFSVYAGRTPSFTSMSVVQTAPVTARTVDTPEMADGIWYFALTATGPTESLPSNVACARLGPGAPCVVGPPLDPPGPVQNFTVVAIVTPPPAALTITVSQNGDTFTWNAAGAGQARIQLQPVGALIDWFRVGGASGANVPATPTVNANGDGVSANAILATLPFANALMDNDGADVTGISVTYAGVTKAMTRSGTTWTVSFP